MLVKKQLPEIIEKGAVIVDVRSPEEFRGASNPKSINIPVDQISKRANELDKSKPIIVCCASGGRSGMAMMVLQNLGFKEVVNAGPWTNTLP